MGKIPSSPLALNHAILIDLTLLGLVFTLSESDDNIEGDLEDSSEWEPVFLLVGERGRLSSPLMKEELSLFIFGDRIAGEVGTFEWEFAM